MIAAQPGWPALVNTFQRLAISKMATAQMMTQVVVLKPVVAKLSCTAAPSG